MLNYSILVNFSKQEPAVCFNSILQKFHQWEGISPLDKSNIFTISFIFHGKIISVRKI